MNLLRSARSNPALSAYAYIYGNFNFAATPLAPPVTKVVVHTDPEQRLSWELNGENGWHVGPAMDHYRCVTCYFPRTRTTRTCETVTFFPHEIPFPQVTLQDHSKQAAEDIVTLLTKPPSSTVPSISAGDPVRNALLEMSEQLQRVEKLPEVAPLDNQLPRVKNVFKPSPRKDVQPPRVA